MLLGVILCQQTTAQIHNWHNGLHLARFSPRSIDSEVIIGLSTTKPTQRATSERALAAGATPAASEFVSASETFFQVHLQKLHDQHLSCCCIAYRQSTLIVYCDTQCLYGLC